LVGQTITLYRTSFTFNESKFQYLRNWRDKIPKDFVIKRIDSTLFEKYKKEMDPLYNLLWSSTEDFLQDGFGFCILKDNQFASVCISFSRDESAEIDILTVEKYRRNGFATLTCAAFIEHCLEHNLVPNWDCDAGNQLSIQLASKLGFEKNNDFPMLWWHENKDVITNYLKKYGYSIQST
jgi:RimJ/RimL family protein N-acetyltransferase